MQAKNCGDVLVVGLIPDSEILRCKGPPVCNEEERKLQVETVKWVDEVITGMVAFKFRGIRGLHHAHCMLFNQARFTVEEQKKDTRDVIRGSCGLDACGLTGVGREQICCSMTGHLLLRHCAMACEQHFCHLSVLAEMLIR